MVLSYRYRLFTTIAQEAALTDMLGAFCDLYNACLQQRIEAYRRRGISLRYGNQSAELKVLRADDERFAAYSFAAEQQVIRRVDEAFSAFFGRIKRGTKAGFPRFRAKARFDSADMRVGDGLTFRTGRKIGIKGIPGDIKVKWHRMMPQGVTLGAAVLSRKGTKWFVCFQIKLPDAEVAEREFCPVGIDLGLTSLVALSTGDTVSTPQYTKNSARSLRTAQRAVARKRQRSRRQRKAKLHVARLMARVANQRRDFSHKLSRHLANNYSHIAFEDLNIKGLSAGMLAKAVHNAAWRQLVSLTTYKVVNAGGIIIPVDPRGTSQTCPDCGTIKQKNLSVREHRCDCGCILDRDVAAARIVLMRASFSRDTAVGREASGLPHSLPEKLSPLGGGVVTQKLEELIATPELDKSTIESAERTKRRIRAVFDDGRRYQATLRSKLTQEKNNAE